MELKPRYKHTEVGVIPEEWELVKLRSLCPKSAYGPRFSSTLYSAHGNVGTLRTTDMDDSGKISYETIPFAHLDENLFKAHFLEDGAFVVTRSGTCGIAAIFHKIERPVVAGAFLIRFQFNDTVHRSFLKDMLNSTRGRRLTDSLIAGGVQKNLSGTGFLNLKIPLPPLPEQKAIAEALSDVDALIESQERLIAKKKQIKQGAMQELLTGKRRLPGFSGEWEEKKLGELFVLKNGFAFASQFFSSSGPIVLTPGNFRLDGGLYFNARNTHRYAGDYAPTHVLNKGDLLIVMTDLTPDCNLLGKPAFLISPETVLHNQRIGKVVQHSNASIPEYLYLLLLSRPYLDRIKDTATGSTVRHTSVNSIYGVSVHLPALSEQTAIAAVLSEMDSEISALEQKLSKTRAIKQGMMQELLTGRIRLVQAA